MKTSIDQFIGDIGDEFLKIRNNLQIHLDENNDIRMKKKFLSSHVPSKVMLSSELLLDTVINALMDEARSELKSASVELQNKFYDHDFRGKVKEWTAQIENKLSLEPEYVKYSGNPQLVNGLIAAGVIFIAGTAITEIAFIPTMVIGAVISEIVTLILSAAAFKFAYDKAEPKAISKMTEDIESYLKSSKEQVVKWLENIISLFDNEFKSFCSNNGWEIQ